MSSRSKEKLASVFHRLFRSSGGPEDAGSGSASGAAAGSPSRRLLLRHAASCYHHHSAEQQPPSRSGTPSMFFKKKSSQTSGASSSGHEQNQNQTAQKSVRTRRLMKELQDIQRAHQHKKKPAFTVELINDNLYDWHVRLYGIDSESELAADMRELGVAYISLQLTFPENFPFVPPFMRVVAPRIEKGFVMEGGAICMELLTPRGWASAYTVEAIVMQFAASIVKGQGRISKKTKSSGKDFNRRSAEESFRSLVKTHDKYGWVTPPLADG
ncbi:hypothetical protein AAG570_001916 [Ranatra chinensis]|uniref:E2 ubiquitin-conjugating enzyme n=1 Tax=Ranatra chinensis TaxID=642074 RepID=A0ABD0YA53_9HEMI